MLDWFAGAVASVNAAKEISQSLITLRDEGLVRSKVFELTNSLMDLQQQLMSAQMEQMQLVQRVQELVAAKTGLEEKQAMRNSYSLHQFPTGAFAYRVDQASVALEGELDHYICSTCFEAGQKVILQPRAYGLSCPKCTTFVLTRDIDTE